MCWRLLFSILGCTAREQGLEAALQRGEAAIDRKEWDKAIAAFTEAIRIDPKADGAHYNRGYAYAEKREYAKAIADFNEAIRLEPNDPMGHSALAWTLATGSDAALRDGKRAIELANRAIKLSKGKDANDFENLAAAYAECGRFDEAVKWQARAIELGTGLLDPDEAEERLELYESGKPFREK